jgi:hypothetical protein
VPSKDIEVQIDIKPRVLNLKSNEFYNVFVTFPIGYDYGEDLLI